MGCLQRSKWVTIFVLYHGGVVCVLRRCRIYYSALLCEMFCSSFCIAALTMDQLPLLLQGVKGLSASRSGILIIPSLLVFVFFALLGGLVVSKNGFYVHPMLVGTALMSIGSVYPYAVD